MVVDFISGRETVREYLDKTVKEEDVKAILEAGRWAPSSLNVQPWDFIVIKDKAMIKKVMGLCYYGNSASDPPLLIALVLDHDAKIDDKVVVNFQKKFSPGLDYINIGMPALNMAYQAQALGLNSCIKCPVSSEVNKLLGIPSGHECAIVVGIGYGDPDHMSFDRERKRLKDIVHYEKFRKK